jgi:phosphate-selective porin OprO/OprP
LVQGEYKSYAYAHGYNSSGEKVYDGEKVDENSGKGGNAYGILGLRMQLNF